MSTKVTHIRAAKRKDAEARNSEWAKLGSAEQLRQLDRRPGKSLRQRLRLQKAITEA